MGPGMQLISNAQCMIGYKYQCDMIVIVHP